jgi:2-polyprenyl-6-methoxyphenol hydroxylase-like FAD-dependent oxidoreductase
MTTTQQPLRIHIVGGSIAGLAAACAALTHHPNCKITVHERAPAGALEERGAGIGGDFTLLKKITGRDPRELGFRYILPSGAICERDTRPGKQIRMRGAWTEDGDTLRCTTTYDNIQNTLAKGFLNLGGNYVNDHTLERMEKSGSVTTLHFADGTKADADLVVCSDGFASPCRNFLYSTRGLRGEYSYTGYVIWRGILYPDEINDPEVLRTLLPNGGRSRSDLWMQPVFNGPSPYALYSLYCELAPRFCQHAPGQC